MVGLLPALDRFICSSIAAFYARIGEYRFDFRALARRELQLFAETLDLGRSALGTLSFVIDFCGRAIGTRSSRRFSVSRGAKSQCCVRHLEDVFAGLYD